MTARAPPPPPGGSTGGLPPPSRWFALGPFVVFDLETTGMSPREGRVIEIGAVRISTDGARTTFHRLVSPGAPISAAVTRLTGIRSADVADAPGFESVGPEFVAFAAGATLAAHNARFDLSFLQEGLARAGHPLWPGDALDTLPIIRKAYPGLPSYSLPALRRSLGLDWDAGRSHTALADALLAAEAFGMAMRRLLLAGDPPPSGR